MVFNEELTMNRDKLTSTSAMHWAVFVLTIFLSGMPFSGYADETKPAGDLARGAKAWSDNCARCHNMRDPKEFRDDQWHVIVSHMLVRAGLIGQDARDILTFLQASN
jgi:hypothetical protein